MDKIFAEFEDDKIKYQLLTKEYVEEALHIMSTTFFIHENVCRSIGLPEDPEAIEELQELTKYVAKDGCTAIAIDKTTNKIAALVFNKINIKDSPRDKQFFDDFAKNCKRKRAKAVVDYLHKADSRVDFFELLKVDCVLEILFGATLPEYRGRGIAKKLRAITVEVAKKLLEGVNVKQAVDDGPQPGLEPVPKAVTSIFTSFITQRIAKQLGFQVAAEWSFEEDSYDGRSFASVVGENTAKAQIAYLKLV